MPCEPVFTSLGNALGSVTGRTATGGMAQPNFFRKSPSSTLAEIAALTKAQLVDPSRGGHEIRGLASLDEAGPIHLAFFDNLKYADQLAATKAGACLVSPRFEASVPAHVAVLRTAQPFHAFVQLAREWHGDALRPQSWFGVDGIAPSAIIDPTAHLEDGVIVDPLAVIGPRVEIGAGTVIGAGAVIAADVRIGRDCNVGARSAIQFALIGNNVLIHPGCSIGQDGYGFIFFGPEGHLKVPQTGRVVIQNRRRSRRRHHHRPRQPARHRDRRGHQNRQSGPDRPQCDHRQALPARGADRPRGQPDDRRQCRARRQGGHQQPSQDRRRRPGHGDERRQGRHPAQWPLGRFFCKADQAVVQGNHRGGAPGAATARPIRRAREGNDGGVTGQV